MWRLLSFRHQQEVVLTAKFANRSAIEINLAGLDALLFFSQQSGKGMLTQSSWKPLSSD